MKKIMVYLILAFATQVLIGVEAQTVQVKSLSSFSTDKPPENITVELLQDLSVEKYNFKAGTKLSGNLTNVKGPKRLKRNAKFSFRPTLFVNADGSSGKIVPEDILADYTVPLDKGQLAKSAAVGVGGFFVKGLGMGVAAVEGAVNNESGNRLKSSAVSVYEASPVSYINKGEDIKIEYNNIFYLNFPDNVCDTSTDELGGKNFEYTIEKE